MIDHEPTLRLDDPTAPLPQEPPAFLTGWTRYIVLRRIGSGGMGEVFKAWDPALNRHVALKFLSNLDQEMVERFQREARSQAKVDHPGICKVFEVGEVQGRPYIAMQEIDGLTLDDAAIGLTVEQKVRLVREIADAIHAAHRQGLIHRDLKPGNILVERSEEHDLRPYVVDFGLARDQQAPSGYTISGAIFGTVGYMSPEQARGIPDTIDRRTDVYNLGVILYELLSGQLPFEFESASDAVVRLQTEEPRRLRKVQPSVPRDLETIVMKCLERDAQRRYDSARAVAEDLTRFLDGEPIMARPASLGYRVAKRLRKHRHVAVVGVVALVLLAITGTWALWSRLNADRRAALAQQFGQQVKEMELVTRMARMLPPERATPARRLLAPRMDRIRAEMSKLGATARGPGHYALARASLALGDFGRAEEMIESAAKAGYDTPEVSYTRGEILGHFYEEALVRAAAINDADLRASALEAAARRFRDPALALLRRAHGASVDNPALLEAKLAFLEEKWDEAIAAARRASSTAPWLYEARMLEATTLRTQAVRAGNAGDLAAARQQLAAAGDAMTAVLQIARSDAMAWVEECRRQSALLRVTQYERWLTQTEIDEALAPCTQALALDPELVQAWETVARVNTSASEDQARRGEDPRTSAKVALAAAARAIALEPRSATGYATRGTAHLSVARWQFGRGEDPRRELEEAQAALRRAVELEPREATLQNLLANSLLIRGFYDLRVGADPTPAVTGAIDHLRKALELSPRFVVAMTNISNAYVQLAERALKSGRPSRDYADAAIEYSNRAVSALPASVSTNNNRGNAFLAHAEAVIAEGGDPSKDVREAIASCEKALALRPDYALAHYNGAYASMLLARWRCARGLDPSQPLAAARAALSRYDSLSPDDPDSALLAARLWLVEADWLARHGRSASAATAHGLEAVAKASGSDAEQVAAQLRSVPSPTARR